MSALNPSLILSELTAFDSAWAEKAGPVGCTNAQSKNHSARRPEGSVALGQGSQLEPVGADDPVLGDPHAPITLLHYGSYGCPASVRLHRTIGAVMQRYGDSLLRYVFRFLPIAELGPGAQQAAEGAEAAAQHGKFWDMHNRLMADPQLHPLSFLTWHAVALGMNCDAFQREMNLHIHAHRADRHAAGALHAKVHNAPVLFINGHRLENEVSDRSITRVIDIALL